VFSALDDIIFPDSCEVIKVTSQQYVYPIFKNGSSSIRNTQILKNWQSIKDHDIGLITEPITVYLRDPRERFVSGVNTFLQFNLRETSTLDTDTVLHFVKQYLFLNRHYAPQFYWLINLARYSQTPLNLQSIDAINQIVDMNDHAGIDPPSNDFIARIKNFPWQQLELYFFLDQILIDQIGKSMTFAQIIKHIKEQHPSVFDQLFKKSKDIVDVLSKT
jgi:hypothetical protein